MAGLHAPQFLHQPFTLQPVFGFKVFSRCPLLSLASLNKPSTMLTRPGIEGPHGASLCGSPDGPEASAAWGGKG
jgi:hypothetical protein